MAATPAGNAKRLGSEAITEGIRVRVEPRFVPEQSNLGEGQWFFAYRVEIENVGEVPATLRRRHWIITDADGDRREVDGEGVIGEQPRLEPGGRHVYESFCPLTTSWGTMEGWYTLERDDGTTFDAKVERFYLASDA